MDDASGMANPAAAKATPEDELTTGRRETQRARVHLSAMLVATTREYAVTLRNISCTGAMVEGDDLPPNGRTVALRRGDIDELADVRSEEHTSELQSLMRTSYAVLCVQKKQNHK